MISRANYKGKMRHLNLRLVHWFVGAGHKQDPEISERPFNQINSQTYSYLGPIYNC